MRAVSMLKISGTTFIMMLAVARSEPPVNSYLPPRTGTPGANGGRTDLSTQYGAPDFNNGGGVNRNSGATSFTGTGGNGAGNGPSKLYDVPIGGNAGGNGLGQFQGNGFRGGQSSSSKAANGGFGEDRGNTGKPSTSYGVPDASGNNGGAFGNVANEGRPSTSYGVPGMSGFGENRGNVGRPSTSYGVPDAIGNNRGGFGNEGTGGRPPTSYGVPGVNGNHEGGNNGNASPPSSSYGVPGANNENTNSKGLFNDGKSNGGPSSNYGSPNENAFGGGLSTSYGLPNRNGNGNSGGLNGGSFVNGEANGYPSGGPNGNAKNFGHDNGSFGRGGERDSGGGYNDNAQEGNTEPAKYEFSYKVKDQQTGSEYSHTETRDGDRAQGEFNVLLPDGRKQIVEYEADQDGFKPQIRYEGEANVGGGYSTGGPNDNNDGYSSGRPGSGDFTNNSGFNGGGSSSGYPSGGPGEGKPGGFNSGGSSGYQSGRPGQSFGRDNDGNLSGDIGGYFSNPSNNGIGDSDNTNVGRNRQNGGNSGYQY
ncbi:pro-resilin [Monomorium pharaonis]|uniref:pro-resilin n=1 Tax=Monomorium pharaonis TaxID=307658 RepID=UPI0017460E33|nr:pro-resilin [Monomorium pharaonis]